MTHSMERGADAALQDGTQDVAVPRRPWTVPALEELPRLTELTLQTGSPIPGGGGPGGGVF